MRKYEIDVDGYILSFGESEYGGETITEKRFNDISEAVRNYPNESETVGYRLRTDLTWEGYEIVPEEPDEPTADEILDILTGGA